jgi:hypothetical protein
MARVPGGPFWVGSPGATGAPEETPRHKTALAPFCIDLTEVTVDAYASCVKNGACTDARGKSRTCNARRNDRGEHPVNCVDWHQALAYCQWRKRRLPTEAEWEYAARGGEQYLKYPWGDAKPDGRACWKAATTCPVKTFAPGAFGVYDMSGNLWEWTASGFGDYPWPPQAPVLRVYRGGSYSRRFEKWMQPRLRNRWGPRDSGSHLGFRCASRAPASSCPFGEGQDGECRYGVTEAECAPPAAWNGIRCAPPGAPRCGAGAKEVSGHGCVGGASGVISRKASRAGKSPEIEATPVTRLRAPQFDEDCRKYQPSRPHAYRYEGGSHPARNAQSSQAGCKNRDVGVGWNSTCCP